jgi:hypothetical protein
MNSVLTNHILGSVASLSYSVKELLQLDVIEAVTNEAKSRMNA